MNTNSVKKPSQAVKCWKSLYLKLTATRVRYPDSDIENELNSCDEYFAHGLDYFWTNVATSYIELRENKSATFMESFYQRLSKMLLVDQDRCKQIFANYLLYNCNNSGILLQERLEKNIRAVLLATWSFYAQERIFFLKCYSHIICSSIDDSSPYSAIFENYILKIPARERYSSLLKQYTDLIHKELPSPNVYGSMADTLGPLWINYNLREQLEVLNLLILITSQIDVTLNDIDKMVELIQITSFGRYQCFFYHHSHLTDNQNVLQQQIHYAVTFYCIQILSAGWMEDIYKDNVSTFNHHHKVLYPSTYDAKQGAIIVAWILLIYRRITDSGHCHEQLSNETFVLLDEDLWKVLDDALHSNIMDTPALAKVIEPVIDDMVFEMFSKFGINAFHSPTTLASIISFFCKLHTFPFNQSTTTVLQYFRERFPLDCRCLFKILSAILNWASDITHRKEIWDLLSSVNYSVRKYECALRTVELNRYALEHDVLPLKHIPSIRIPRGTAASPDFDDGIVTLHKSLPTWDVMRNYLMTYLNGEQGDELVNTIIEIINFVEISLQRVKRIDGNILRLSELVVHVMWKSSTDCSSVTVLKLLASCIQLQSILFCIIPEDIIKCFEIYNFLPGYPMRMKRTDVPMHDMYFTQSRIYAIVCCKEAKIGDYSVLFSYLNFFHNVVQNILESWYTVAGLKFIFHVYNNVNNDFWKFKNRDDRNLIIWKCIEVLHEVLNRGLKDLYDCESANNLLEFREVEDSFVAPTTYFVTKFCVQSILNNVNEATVLSTAVTGEATLLETVIESACWNKGKSAIFINTITYALSLMQRCLIYVDVEKKLKKVDIGLDHLFQPDKCLALLSYRYNCFSDNISLLAIKLLIKLANMKENCMFSWLQYSNELLQKEFLYPLYSSNESNVVKSSLLALMAVCIMRQIVIADALLEIDKVRKICVEKSKANKTWKNLLVFTSVYIQDMKSDSEVYLSNMHCAVLNVVYVCWAKKLKVPQQFYKMSDEFWKNLMLPLNDEPCISFGGYKFILEIICLEIVGTKSLDTNLNAQLESLLNSDRLIEWTEYFASTIDESSKLTVEFESIPVSKSSVAECWKKFIQVVTSQCTDLIEKPAATALPIYKCLVDELSYPKFKEKEKFLCDMYRIFVATWTEKCSESSWQQELNLTSRMFVILNESYREYSTPYFFSALLEIGYKTYQYAKKHEETIAVLKGNPDFMMACTSILNLQLKDFNNLVGEGKHVAVEYAPLLLHLCILIDLIETLDVPNDSIMFMWRETDLTSQVLATNNTLLKLRCATKTSRMLLQFQNFIFHKFDFLRLHFTYNHTIIDVFHTVFPVEFSSRQDTFEMFTNAETNEMFTSAVSFLNTLTKRPSRGSKTLLVEFSTRNKSLLSQILNLITVSLRKEDLNLITAVIVFYKRIVEHIHFCTYDDVNELTEPLFVLFGCVKTAISYLIQATKLCSVLFGVASHHLQQYFDDADDCCKSRVLVEKTYKSLIYVVNVGIQTLSAFCLSVECLLDGHWPSEDWNFRWLNKITDGEQCLLPILFLNEDNLQEDFTIFATFITLEYRSLTDRASTDQNISIENLTNNKVSLLTHKASAELVCELSTFLLRQSSMYLLHPQIDQGRKLFFINQIFVNMKEFIRNAIHDNAWEENTGPSTSSEVAKDQRIVKDLLRSMHFRSCECNIDPICFEELSDEKQMNFDEKTQFMLVHIAGKLFFKLITTFKHS